MSLRPLWICIAICCAVPAASATAPAGLARAKDGDSLMVGDTEVRLFGIDAPEFDQTCKRGPSAGRADQKRPIDCPHWSLASRSAARRWVPTSMLAYLGAAQLG